MPFNNILAVGADRYRLVQQSRDDLLRNQGYSVTSTSDIHEALKFFAAREFDLVLLCHSMTDKDKRKMLRAVKKGTPEVPVLALYGGSQSKADGGAMHSRSDPQSMLDAVGHVLGGPRPPRKMGSFDYRILVVDNETSIRETAAAILESHGYEVHTAEDGIAALKVLDRSLPDVIITDLRMSNMDGFEFLSIVRKRFPQIAAIVISDEFAAGTRPNGLIADAFFQKGSYAPEHLFHKILELLKKSPLRSNSAKPTFAPVWIARPGGADKALLTCTDCLRSFPVTLSGLADGIHQQACPSCRARLSFEVHPAMREQWNQGERPSTVN